MVCTHYVTRNLHRRLHRLTNKHISSLWFAIHRLTSDASILWLQQWLWLSTTVWRSVDCVARLAGVSNAQGTSATHARKFRDQPNSYCQHHYCRRCDELYLFASIMDLQKWNNERLFSTNIQLHRRHRFIENSTWASWDTFLLELWVDYMWRQLYVWSLSSVTLLEQ